MSIETRNITKIFKNQRALDNVSFTITPGQVVGFLGPNGAGKSTLMRILTGFIPPTSGSAFVHGIDVMEKPLEVKRIIGYLPENNPLYVEMYVREFLEFVAGLYKLPNPRKRAEEMIEITGLQPERKKKIGTLSKGYRQRVGIAQALIHNPQVLILDEPTSGLDPNQIVEIRNLIKTIGHKKTVMLSTHIMQEVEAICDRAIIIHQGRIVADENIDQLRQIFGDRETVLVEFSKPIDLSRIRFIEGVRKVEELEGNKFLLITDGETDIREEIFRIAIAEGNTVLTMQKQTLSLEEIFRKLTSS